MLSSFVTLIATWSSIPLLRLSSGAFCASFSRRVSANTSFRPVSILFSASASSTLAHTTTASSSTIMTSSSPNPTDPNTALLKEDEPKLAALRKNMSELGLDAYIIPSDDPHLSEYVPRAYMRRAFMTHFEGSAGTALVLSLRQSPPSSTNASDFDTKYPKDQFHDALLWTDSRYFNEASLQLSANYWTLMKQGLPSVPNLISFLTDYAKYIYRQYNRPVKIGIDPFVHPASFVKELLESFENASKDIQDEGGLILGEIDTLDTQGNLIDPIWGNDRPCIPKSPFRVHPLEYAGKSVVDKIKSIQDQMKEKKVSLSVFSALDDIAYLFNVRAKGDVETCPVGISYATIHVENGAVLYCDEEKITPLVSTHLQKAQVTVRGYDSIVSDIKDHLTNHDSSKVWLDTTRSNYALSRLVPTKQLLDAPNAIISMKACKNEIEMKGMRQAHILDGAAMAHFMAWLEDEVINKERHVSEVEIDHVLTGYRTAQPGFVELSFPTIAGVASNGAIIHYRAKEDSSLLKYVDSVENPMILLDSGGQYEYGTTDVTRTWYLGVNPPDSEYMDHYTRVLKGNIGVDAMVFPENTPGFVLDVFARKALWEVGRDYGHGTGHGVGAALNVHEGPHSISPRWTNMEALKKGMVVSNEPGYYEDGKFGIRIENLLEITYVNEEDNVAYGKGLKAGDEGYPKKPPTQKTFLKFNKLTMIPIQKNLIKLDLMSSQELDWLDNYHHEVFEKVSPLLEEGSPAMNWLKKSCTKIDRTKPTS